MIDPETLTAIKKRIGFHSLSYLHSDNKWYVGYGHLLYGPESLVKYLAVSSSVGESLLIEDLSTGNIKP